MFVSFFPLVHVTTYKLEFESDTTVWRKKHQKDKYNFKANITSKNITFRSRAFDLYTNYHNLLENKTVIHRIDNHNILFKPVGIEKDDTD